MSDIILTLKQLAIILGQLFVELVQLGATHALFIFFVAWCLWGINWSKAWPILARGAWAPLLLLMIMCALVWSRIAPSNCTCLKAVTVPNFWWQLGSVGLLTAVALFCGYVQGYFGWVPPEVQLEPPAVEHGHGHH